jgi:hypothetical protein
VKAPRAALVGLLLLASVLYAAVLPRDLPYAPGSDEVDFLLLSIPMAQMGDPNPRWFGHPGSTFLLPFAVGVRLVATLESPGADGFEAVRLLLEPTPGQVILIGRFLSAVFALMALAVLVRLGDRAWAAPVGWIAGLLTLSSPFVTEYVTQARTDGAGLFFGTLALLALVRVRQRPEPGPQGLAGLALGLGLATRYFLAAALPLLLLIDLQHWRGARRAQGPERHRIRRGIAIGWLGVPLGLVIGSPFLLTELPQIGTDLLHESRTSHPGADGLGWGGNLLWYLRVGVPEALPLPVLGLTLFGIMIALVRRRGEPLLLLLFTAIFLMGISLSNLHWSRWLVQIAPLLNLFAAAALVETAGACGERIDRAFGRPVRSGAVLTALATTALLFSPAAESLHYARASIEPSTRDRARQWILANLPPETRIAADLYTAPLQDSPFADTQYTFSWAEKFRTPVEVRRAGYDVLMVSSAVHGRYLGARERYPRQARFYRKLFRNFPEIVEFRSQPGVRGPTIRIYDLRRARWSGKAEKKGAFAKRRRGLHDRGPWKNPSVAQPPDPTPRLREPSAAPGTPPPGSASSPR